MIVLLVRMMYDVSEGDGHDDDGDGYVFMMTVMMVMIYF